MKRSLVSYFPLLLSLLLTFNISSFAQKGKPQPPPSCAVPPPVPVGGYCLSGDPGSPGCLDSSFGGGTGRVLGPRNLEILQLGMQTFGLEEKIVAFGRGVTSYDPCVQGEGALLRFHADGTPDLTFGTNGVVHGFPLGIGQKGMVVQPDNKIVVVGQASIQLPAERGKKPVTLLVPAVARYTPDGSLETGFGNGGLVAVPFGTYQGFVQAVAVQSDGKIVATGKIVTAPWGGTEYIAVLRLLPNGSLDTTFNGTGRFIYSAYSSRGEAVAIQKIDSQERVIVAGVVGYGALLRFTPTGALDTSFGGTGVVSVNLGDLLDVAVDALNRIVAIGNPYSYPLQLVRYDQSGNLDPSFGEGGFVFPPYRLDLSSETVSALAIQPDGYILTTGTAWAGDRPFMVIRQFAPDGSISASFGDAGSVLETFLDNGAATGRAILLNGDYKVVTAGRGPYVSPYFGAALARFWTKVQPPPPQ